MTQAELQILLTFLAETPEVVRRLTCALSAETARRKPTPAEFSALEHVCHLRDIEQEGYSVRLSRLLTEEAPTLADIDGARLAREREYQRQDFTSALADFTHARRENIARARTLTPAQLARAGTFEGVGEVTTARLLEMMRTHDEAHRAELTDLTAHLRADT